MPYREKSIVKKYYTIGEVAEMFLIPTSAIRFWETEFDCIVAKRRSRENNRLYTAKDIQSVRTVYNLLYTEGFTIPGAKKRMEEIKQKIF
jgi:DNA-binding transcriptional MerR regulator